MAKPTGACLAALCLLLSTSGGERVQETRPASQNNRHSPDTGATEATSRVAYVRWLANNLGNPISSVTVGSGDTYYEVSSNNYTNLSLPSENGPSQSLPP